MAIIKITRLHDIYMKLTFRYSLSIKPHFIYIVVTFCSASDNPRKQVLDGKG